MLSPRAPVTKAGTCLLNTLLKVCSQDVCETSLPSCTFSLHCFLESPPNKPLAPESSSQGPVVEEELKKRVTGPFCYGLNCVPPDPYIEALTPHTSECDYT